LENPQQLKTEDIRKEVLDFLSGKYRSVKDVPKEVLKTFPFIDLEMIFEIENTKTALILEKEMRAPRWVTYVVKHEDVLKKHGFEMGIVKLQNKTETLMFPNYRDIEAALGRESFGLYLIRNKQLDCVYHNRLMSSCGRLAQAEASPLFERLRLNKHIPSVVTDNMKKLQKVSLADSLKDIAIEYDARTFDEPDEEYDFIQEAMKDILERAEFKDLNAALGFLRLTENQLRTKGKRDHFLHSFQVFLVGEIVIDARTEIIMRKLGLETSSMVSLERCWLLASLLHDIGIPFQNREWIDEIGDFEIKLLDDPRQKHYIDDLAACFSNLTGKPEDSLRKILYARAQQENARGHSEVNHGLISAVQVLKKSMAVSAGVYKNEALPAALSMAIHDRQLWHDLARHQLAPIDELKLPITSLLILCDNFQVWGRPGRKGDATGENTALKDLKTGAEVVDATLLFNSISEASMFRWEFQELLNHVITSKELFNITINEALVEN
jgi:hypothetical protein